MARWKSCRKNMWILVIAFLTIQNCYSTFKPDCTGLISRFKYPIDYNQFLDEDKILESNPICNQIINQELLPIDVSLYSSTEMGSKRGCLFFDNENLENIKLFGLKYSFNGNAVSNIKQMYDHFINDKNSLLYIQSVGSYSWRDVKNLYSNFNKYINITFDSVADIQPYPIASIKLTYVTREQWLHLDNLVHIVPYVVKFVNYPCSTIIYSQNMKLSEFTLRQLSLMGKGQEENVCRQLLLNCQGTNIQFSHFNSCLSYMRNLPHHDDRCVRKYGTPYAIKGKSFMCKYLNHFMIAEQPEKYCSSVGNENIDAESSCSDNECSAETIDNNNKHVRTPDTLSSRHCDQSELDELTSAAIYATFYCLPSLNTNTCLDGCLRALNTLLGRFLQNKTICRCIDEKVQSKLLNLLELDVHVLLSICRGKMILSYSCDKERPVRANEKCLEANDYQSLRGCTSWNWSKFERGMFHEWERMGPRVTKSNLVASAECFVFTKLLSLRNNHENMLHVFKYISDKFAPENVFIHPSLDHNIEPMVSNYGTVNRTRTGYIGSWDMDVCMLESMYTLGNRQLSSSKRTPITNFIQLILPGLLKFRKNLDPVLKTKRNNKFIDNTEWLKDDIVVEMFYLLFGRNSITSSDTWRTNLLEFIKSSAYLAYDKGFHTIHGNTLALEYLRARRNFIKSLKRMSANSTSAVAEINDEILRSGLNITEADGYTYTANTISLLGEVHLLVNHLIQSIKMNPCTLMPLWRSNSTRFAMEFIRLNGQNNGLRMKKKNSNESTFYSVVAANLDANIFKDPLTFNPERHNLNDILIVDRIQGSISSLGKTSIFNQFTIKCLTVLPLQYLPDITYSQHCHQDIRIMSNTDVKFNVEMIEVGKGKRQLEVYKYKPFHSSAGSLIIALHTFLGMPQHFAKLFGKLKDDPRIKNFEYWAPTLPGWGRSSGIDCHLSVVSKLMYDFITEELKNGKRDIYLMGHGLGGAVLWIVSDMITRNLHIGYAGRFKGFISLGVAHPFSHITDFRNIGFTSKIFDSFLSDMNDAYLNADDFKFFKELLNVQNSKWWKKEWDDEHLLFWKKTGISNLRCYCKDNIYKREDGSLSFIEKEHMKNISPDTHILMIGGENNRIVNHEHFLHSLKLLPKRHRKLLSYHRLQEMNHFDLLLDDDNVKTVATKISNFVDETWRLSHSLTIYSWIRIPIRITDEAKRENIEDISTVYIIFATFLMLVVGFSFEIHFGTSLKKIANSELKGLFEFGEAMVAPITVACAFSRSWIGIVFFAYGAFKLGIPDITLYMPTPFKPCNEYSDLSTNATHNEDISTKQSSDRSHSKSKLNYLFFKGTLKISLTDLISEALSFSLGFAILLHHVAGFLIYASVLCDMVHPYELIFVIPASIQHVSAFLITRCFSLYITIMFICEIWFQLEGFYMILNLETVPAIATYMILTAHYMYWLQGILSQILKLLISLKGGGSKKEEEEDEVELNVELKQVQYETYIE